MSNFIITPKLKINCPNHIKETVLKGCSDFTCKNCALMCATCNKDSV
jgi:hypothetical protein